MRQRPLADARSGDDREVLVERQILALQESDDESGGVTQPGGNIPDEHNTRGGGQPALEDEPAHVEIEGEQDWPVISRDRQDVLVG